MSNVTPLRSRIGWETLTAQEKAIRRDALAAFERQRDAEMAQAQRRKLIAGLTFLGCAAALVVAMLWS